MQIHRCCSRLATLCLVLAGVLVLGTTRQALADVYKYVDPSGKVYFTDVPLSGAKFTLEWQRASAKLIDENKKKLLASGRVEAPSKSATKRRNEHARLIDAAARQYGLIPELLHAVIRTESAYNPGAVSSAGAIGLMQLMPGTAARYKVRDIWEPAANVRGGAAYLRDLLDMFDQDLRLALAGYNAGEGAVIKYGRQIPPYPETQQYVRKVLQFLWDEQRSVPARKTQPLALATAHKIQASALTKIAKAP